MVGYWAGWAAVNASAIWRTKDCDGFFSVVNSNASGPRMTSALSKLPCAPKKTLNPLTDASSTPLMNFTPLSTSVPSLAGLATEYPAMNATWVPAASFTDFTVSML